MKTTFLLPSFSKSDVDKVNNLIRVPSKHVLVKAAKSPSVPAISSEGFPANRDGTYVFVTRIDDVIPLALINIGFTSTKTLDSGAIFAYPSFGGINGACLNLEDGCVWSGSGENPSKQWHKNCLPFTKTCIAKEIISILTIAENGKMKQVQFIADGNESAVHELRKVAFENTNGGDEIYPVLTICKKSQKVNCIPFNQVKSRSPKIERLMKELLPKPRKQLGKTKKVGKKNKKAVAKKKTAKTARKSNKKAGKKIAKK